MAAGCGQSRWSFRGPVSPYLCTERDVAQLHDVLPAPGDVEAFQVQSVGVEHVYVREGVAEDPPLDRVWDERHGGRRRIVGGRHPRSSVEKDLDQIARHESLEDELLDVSKSEFKCKGAVTPWEWRHSERSRGSDGEGKARMSRRDGDETSDGIIKIACERCRHT